jgi:hypothetical protein
MTCCWSRFVIPNELFSEIKLFLTDKNYWKFLSSSKQFSDISFWTRKICLNEKWSQRLLEDKELFKKIFSKIHSPQNQLVMKLSASCKQVENVLVSIPCFELILFGLPVKAEIVQKKKMQISLNNDMVIFPAIDNMESLELFYFAKLRNIQSLKSLNILTLANCHAIIDVVCLKNLQELNILNCNMLEDVSLLGNIRKLQICGCRKVVDLSALTNNSHLIIRHCQGVKLFPSSMNVVKFDCNLRGFSTEGILFPRLKTLSTIDHFLESYPSFHRLFCLKLHDNENIKILNGTKTIQVVHLTNLNQLEDISEAFGENQVVTISDCPKITDFSSLKNITKVTIEHCQSFIHGEQVENVIHLTVRHCSNFNDWTMLKKLSDFNNFTTVNGFEVKKSNNI